MEEGAPIPLVGLTGTFDSSAALDRNHGLQQAAEQADVHLHQLISAAWNEQEAREKTRILLRRYPDTRGIWSASDGMALGAIQALKDAGKQPGEDVLVGGVDWEPRALEAIRDGTLALSFGRHFLEGGAVLLLLDAFHRGETIFPEDPSPPMRYPMEPATRANLDRIERIIDPENWDRVDFSRLSADDWRTPDGIIDPEALMNSVVSLLAEAEPD